MKKKFQFAMTLAVILAMLLTSFALADDVSNTLDGTIDAVAEIMPLNAGGSNGSTTLYIKPRNEDGKPGCNLTSGSTLVVLVSSTAPSVATVSPNSITFTSCDDTPALTITPHSQGSTKINVSQTSNNTGATFTFTGATFLVNVAPPANTAPQVSIIGVNAGGSYEFGSVPAATCQVTDAEDGNSSFAATLSAVTGPLALYGLGEQTASCAYTDAGGLLASASVTYGIVDTTAPEITFVGQTPDANGNGWNNGDVTLEWSCSDSVGVLSATVSETLTSEAADQSATGTCEDVAGNTASDTQYGINIDKTAPSVALVGGPADGSSHYFGSVPAAPTCSASDGLSGLDGSCSISGYSAAVGPHTVSASATDKAGNSASASATYTVLAWTLNGFFQPVDMSGVYNVVRGGSTVPLKFEVFAGTTELTDISVVQSFVQTRIACDGTSPVDDVEFTTTGATSLRYDATAGQFIQNWQTPRSPGQCYRVTMTTDDGSSLVALFKLK